MNSEELIEIFSKTRRTKDISLTVEQVEDLIKKLEVLEIFKKWFMGRIINYFKYDNSLFIDTFIHEDEPIFKILKGWLDEA